MLRIAVRQRHAMAQAVQPSGQVNGDGGFSDPALGIGDSDDHRDLDRSTDNASGKLFFCLPERGQPGQPPCGTAIDPHLTPATHQAIQRATGNPASLVAWLLVSNQPRSTNPVAPIAENLTGSDMSFKWVEIDTSPLVDAMHRGKEREYREMKHRLPGNETSKYRDLKHLLPGNETPLGPRLPGSETLFGDLTGWNRCRIDRP